MCRILYLLSNENIFSPFYLYFDKSNLVLFNKSYPSESTLPEHSDYSLATLPDGRNPFDARITTSNILDRLFAQTYIGHLVALGYKLTRGISIELLTLFNYFLIYLGDVYGNASLNY